MVDKTDPDLSSEIDIQSTITHELGHLLGFADDYRYSASTVMCGYSDVYQTRLIHNSLRNPLSILYYIDTTPGLLRKETNNEK